MIRCGTVLRLTALFFAFGDARISALSATDPAGLNLTGNTISQGIVNAEPESLGPARWVAPELPLLRGNPLWAIPLRSLSATQERPLFSPSRRPPPLPVVAAPYVAPAKPPPPKPAEPDHPLLELVGTVVGDTSGIGVFVDQATSDVLRLRTGQDHGGWVLRSVHAREVAFEKDSQKATLALPPLPPPGADPSARLPGLAAPAAQAGNTWRDGDGQLISPPLTKTSQPTSPIAPVPVKAANGWDGPRAID